MTWLDIVILLPLLIGIVRGVMRGLITEVIAILAVILGFIGAKIWGQDLSCPHLLSFDRICGAVWNEACGNMRKDLGICHDRSYGNPFCGNPH